MLFHWMTKSPAWKATDANERAAYLEIAMRYNGSNNGSITCSVREIAASLHVGKSTATAALNRLEQKGFIRTMKKGTFNLKCRHATEWRMTEHHCDVSGKPASKDMMTWPILKRGSDPGTDGT